MKTQETVSKQLPFGFSKFELGLWLTSVVVILCSFVISRNTAWLYLVTSLVGATGLIFLAKGNVTGQILTVVFSILYGIISYSYRYYGEMITYLGMTLPIAAVSVIAWLRHPYRGRKSEVQVNKLRPAEYAGMALAGVVVTLLFGLLLKRLNTANLILSTVSVLTSFVAVYLSMRRSPYYALGYAANDAVLIALWLLASAEEPEYLCMVFCFVAFLANDVYGFVSWRRMGARQNAS